MVPCEATVGGYRVGGEDHVANLLVDGLQAKADPRNRLAGMSVLDAPARLEQRLDPYAIAAGAPEVVTQDNGP